MSKNEKRKGIVLVGVLAFIVLLLGVLMEFTYRSKVQLDITHNRLQAARVKNAACSVIDITRALLSYSTDMNAPEVRAFFEEEQEMLFNGVELTINLDPESRKINLNRLVRGGSIRGGYRSLLNLADIFETQYDERVITTDMIISILEWISEEGVVERLSIPGESAGSDYYSQKSPPYECKHAQLNSISELLLVKDITEEVLYGRPATPDGEEARLGLADFVTLFGGGERIREGDVELEDLKEQEPEDFENFITVRITAKLGNVEHHERVIVKRENGSIVSREKM